MSRIGRKPIDLPAGVTAKVSGDAVSVKGPKGEVSHPRHPRIEVEMKGTQITFTRPTDRSPDRAAHGLMRSLVAGAVEGVTKGFEKVLEINGVGYRAQVEGQKLTLAVGRTRSSTRCRRGPRWSWPARTRSSSGGSTSGLSGTSPPRYEVSGRPSRTRARASSTLKSTYAARSARRAPSFRRM
jgi:hypothetical protein